MVRLTSLPSLVAAPPSRIAQPPKHIDEFYRSKPWLALMAKLKAERGAQCERCGTMQGKIHGDHIRERKDGGASLDERNVKLLCIPCHSVKTQQARAMRARGQVYSQDLE